MASTLLQSAVCGLCRHVLDVSEVIPTDNPALSDLGNLLDIQLGAVYGTYVKENDRLCFNPSVEWSRRGESHLEYNMTQVSSLTCLAN